MFLKWNSCFVLSPNYPFKSAVPKYNVGKLWFLRWCHTCGHEIRLGFMALNLQIEQHDLYVEKPLKHGHLHREAVTPIEYCIGPETFAVLFLYVYTFLEMLCHVMSYPDRVGGLVSM